jgi:hypothetical protein
MIDSTRGQHTPFVPLPRLSCRSPRQLAYCFLRSNVPEWMGRESPVCRVGPGPFRRAKREPSRLLRGAAQVCASGRMSWL